MIPVRDGPWVAGINSLAAPEFLQPGSFQWSVNALNKGGIISTRPGFKSIPSALYGTNSYGRGVTTFTPKDVNAPYIVYARGQDIWFSPYPYNADSITQLNGELLDGFGPVIFETAVKAVTEDEDGNITAIEPYPILLISDGVSKTIYWDGVNIGRLDLICSNMKWIGNRLWTMSGKQVRASNLLDPLSHTEEDVLAEGGYFTLPDTGTGFGVTPDFRSLLVFTDFTTTAIQAGIQERAQWQRTPDFQKVLFASIGCAAGKTIVNQYGLTWWLSHDGLMSLDSALQTYRSSKISFKDRNMARSIGNLSDDISGACAGTFGNYLMLSVPSGDSYNYYTWILDESVNESLGSESPPVWPSVWTGIRPVQWVTAKIKGRQRCFVLSNNVTTLDDAPIGRPNPGIFEAFIKDKRDIVYDQDINVLQARAIPCYFETRLLGNDDTYKRFSHAEIDVGEITDSVDVEVFYAGRYGVYKKVLDKTIAASRNSIVEPDTEEIPEQFQSWLPQKRAIKSVTETLLAADNNPSVEKPFNRAKDKGFSLLIKWTGQMSIYEIRVYLDEDKDAKIGAAESDEVTQRYITISGESGISDDAHVNLSVDISEKSGYSSPVTPRWFEEQYNCLDV